MTDTWNFDDPEKSGYYIAMHLFGDGHPCVSQLWFNPDSSGKWWSSRGYFHERDIPRPVEPVRNVVAWMPMPEPLSKHVRDGAAYEAALAHVNQGQRCPNCESPNVAKDRYTDGSCRGWWCRSCGRTWFDGKAMTLSPRGKWPWAP